jgi:uncharacterized protein
MTLKDALLRSLEDIAEITNYSEVYKHIVKNHYYDFGDSKHPTNTVSASLGNFVKSGDTRVKRIGMPGGNYSYYLTKNEDAISVDSFTSDPDSQPKKTEKTKGYEERDLHVLLSTYLKNTGIYSKTIFHEQSNGKDSNQIWTHPDMVGVKFQKLLNGIGQNFMNAISKVDTIRLQSYELKREINTDSELKKSFFQAVSNSSWSNYGYLVAFEISTSLLEEMDRLNQSFGIGIIQLAANPFHSKPLFPAKFRELDFKTIDKLCRLNRDFEKFIEQIEKLLISQERYFKSTEKELEEFCDPRLKDDTEIDAYCRSKNIPAKSDFDDT